MGKHGPLVLLCCVLVIIPASHSQTHKWTFDSADSVDNIKDDVSGTPAVISDTNGGGSGKKYITLFNENSKYLTLQGENQRITLGTFKSCLGNLNKCDNGFTLLFWLRLRSSDKVQYIFSSSVNSTLDDKRGFHLMIKNAELQIALTDEQSTKLITVQDTFPNNRWIHFALTVKGDDILSYKNGLSVSSTKKETAPPPKTNTTVLTALNLGGGSSIDADVDDIKVWHDVLDKKQINAIFMNYIDDLVISSKCTGNSTSLCISTNDREDFYSMIKSDTIQWSSGEGFGDMLITDDKDNKECITKLAPLTEYEIQIETELSNGRKIISKKVVCKTTDGVPMLPTDLKLEVISTTTVVVSWSAPDDKNAVIKHTKVIIHDLPTSDVKKKKSYDVSYPSDTITIDELEPGTKYRVSVAFVSSVADGPDVSDTIETFKEAMIQNIRVTDVKDTSMKVIWDPNNQQKTIVPKLHKIHYKAFGGEVQTVETTDSSVVLRGLTPLTFYSVNVHAKISSGYKKLLERDIVRKTKGTNECEHPTLNVCDSMANCTDTEKSFICTCPAGYVGDGRVCHRIPSYATDSFYCPAQSDRNLDWPKFYYGSKVAKVACPKGVHGYATRKCIAPTLYSAAMYAPRDLSRCVSKEVRELESSIIQLDDGTRSVFQVTDKILKTIQPLQLYGGDIKAIVSYAKRISNEDLPNDEKLECAPEDSVCPPPGAKDIGKKFTEMASKLLSDDSEDAWYDIPEADRRNQAEQLLNIMQKVAVQVIESTNDDKFEVQRDNAVIKIMKNLDDASLKTYDENGTLGYMIDIPEDDPNVAGLQNTPLLFTKFDNIGNFLNNPTGNQSVSPSIISATFIGKKKMTFTKPVVISVPHPKGFDVSNPSCVYWDESNNEWSSEGCEVNSSGDNYTVCNCYHLTNFAVLMALSPAGILNIITGANAYSLKIITYIGLIVSIIALSIALLTFIAFRFLRSKRIICHTHLVLALLLASITFLTGIEGTANPSVCSAVAALLEYFYLVAFFWMAVEGLLLYFMLKKIFKEVKLFRKSAFHLTIWILPAAYVMVMFAIFPQHYGTPNYCWLSTSGGFIWTFVLPVLLVILFNVCIMGMALHTMANRNNDTGDTLSQNIWYWMKGMFILMCILGVTWVFGLLHIDSNSVGFAYIFAILNAFQGVFIFIFHCLIDPKVRNEYMRILKCQPRSEFNEKNSSNSTRYHKVSTTVSSTGGTLKRAPPESPTEFHAEKQPFFDGDTPSAEVPSAPSKPQVYRDDLSKQSSHDSSPSSSDIEKGLDIPKVKSQPYARISPEKPHSTPERRESPIEEMIMCTEEAAVECEPELPGMSGNYEELPRKKGKGKKMSDSAPTNSVEELLKLFGDNDKNNVVIDIPEPEPSFPNLKSHPSRDSTICEQVIIKDVESNPWRQSLFKDEEDDKKRASVELRQFSRELSETKGEPRVQMYQSNENLAPKAPEEEEIQPVVASISHAPATSFDFMDSNESLDDQRNEIEALADELEQLEEPPKPAEPVASPILPFKFDINVSFTLRDSVASTDSDDFRKSIIEVEKNAEEPVPEYVPDVPSSPEPEPESIPEVESVPEIPEIPELPEMPGLQETATIPEIPEIPEIPVMPETVASEQESATEEESDQLKPLDRDTLSDNYADTDSSDNKRTSIPSKIMKDIGEVMADMPEKPEDKEPPKRQRVKSKVRPKPKPLSLSSSFESNSNTDSDRESDSKKKTSAIKSNNGSSGGGNFSLQSPNLDLFKEIEDEIEKDQEDAINRKSPKISLSGSVSPASSLASPTNLSPGPLTPTSSTTCDDQRPVSPTSPKFRCEMEIVQFQPGDSVIGSPTHTIVDDLQSDEESRM